MKPGQISLSDRDLKQNRTFLRRMFENNELTEVSRYFVRSKDRGQEKKLIKA